MKTKNVLKRLVLLLIVITMTSITVSAGIDPPIHMAPTAILYGPIYKYIGNNVILDGSNSHAVGVYYITQYCFDYGKGSGWESWQSQSTATTSYSSAGAYTARLKVMDNDSYQSPIDSTTVFINGQTGLSAVSVDHPLTIWHVDHPVDFDVSVQDTNGGNMYWINITHFYIYDSIYPSPHVRTDLLGTHWETTTNPLYAGGPAHDFSSTYSGVWETNQAGTYWVQMFGYAGNGQFQSTMHQFIVIRP
jgi:hypothetical protein